MADQSMNWSGAEWASRMAGNLASVAATAVYELRLKSFDLKQRTFRPHLSGEEIPLGLWTLSMRLLFG